MNKISTDLIHSHHARLLSLRCIVDNDRIDNRLKILIRDHYISNKWLTCCVNLGIIVKRGAEVKQFDKEGNYIKTFESVKAAEYAIGSSHIASVCKGIRKTAKGFIFRYKEKGEKGVYYWNRDKVANYKLAIEVQKEHYELSKINNSCSNPVEANLL